MRQAVRREALKTYFVPNTGVGAADDRNMDGAGAWAGRHAGPPAKADVRAERKLLRSLRRAAITVFWSLAGEKTLANAMSQQRIPGALLNGSLAAGTAYLQERHARRRPLASPDAKAKRSLFSFYAAIGMGVGLGAMLVNRQRG